MQSHKAAGLAVKMGYTNVAVYNEGLPAWLARGYPAEIEKVYPAVEVPVLPAAEVKALLDARKAVVLDIRDDVDAEAGRIKGSLDIPIELLDGRLAKVPKSKKIVLMDLHGKRTHQVARFLVWKGYGDVARLDGGFVSGWLKAGYPFVK